jgi:hypothetical protein
MLEHQRLTARTGPQKMSVANWCSRTLESALITAVGIARCRRLGFRIPSFAFDLDPLRVETSVPRSSATAASEAWDTLGKETG